MGAAAPIIAATVLTSGAVYASNQQSRQARRAARTAADQQKEEQLRREAEIKQKQQDASADRSRSSMLSASRAIARQRLVSGTRGGTILTTPLGINGSNNAAQKTLLGT